MVALKPVLQLWLQHAEAEVMAREQMRVGASLFSYQCYIYSTLLALHL